MQKPIMVKGAKRFVMASLIACASASSMAHDHPLNVAEPTAEYGQAVFKHLCVLCHGPNGEGDGRMAKVIKTPPPFDLTASRLPDGYLRDIITKGSEAMGRSKHMPPWGETLHDVEIESLMLYLKTIRD